jgi:hypothetical protein
MEKGKANALNTKVERYIELSIKFQKSVFDLFGESNDVSYINGNTISFNNSTGAFYIGTPITDKSRADKIREKAETEAKLAEEYDEYINLQRDLRQYYAALNKIENN